ncbi:class I SAM-dependent methyltransferase [bacterium]|nr:class I SAM-dependent methyltransferase [bacterium]
MSASYPRTEHDKKLIALGYDLLDENREAVRLAQFNKNAFVLDVATGSGRMLLALADAGYYVISCDIDERTIRETHDRLIDFVHDVAEFRVMDAGRLDFGTDSVESIATANAMHHMANPVHVLEELTRVLKPDGKLLIADFNGHGFDVIDNIHLELHGSTHDRGKTATGTIDLFLRKNFNSVERRDLPLNRFWIASRKRPRQA